MLPRVSKRYFAPALNLWYRAIAAPESSTAAPWRVQVGITERGLDDLGDVTAVKLVNKQLLSSGAPVVAATAGQDLLDVQWEGYAQTTADELYHTVWETIEGIQTIPSPVSGHVERIVENVDKEEVDEETVLVEVSCDEDSLQQAAMEWLELDEYTATLKQQSPGKFDDSL